MERQALIDRLNAARGAIDATVAGIDPECDIYPGWTIKHLLSHLAGWDDAVLASLRAHMGGKEPGTPADEGIDAYNEVSVETRQPLSLAQVRSECDLSRRELLELVTTMPDELYEAQLTYPWGYRGNVETLVFIFAHHEEEHAAEIAELVAQGKIMKEAQ